MFTPGDKVTYKSSGVCVLEGTVIRGGYGAKAEYYVLRPLARGNSTVFVPCANAELTSSIRRIMSKAEARDFLSQLSSQDELWSDDERQRTELYRSIVSSGDRLKLGALIRTLCGKRSERATSGKKLYACDERYLKEAQEILCGEIAASLEVTEEEALTLILDKA